MQKATSCRYLGIKLLLQKFGQPRYLTVAHKGHLDIFDRDLITRDRDLVTRDRDFITRDRDLVTRDRAWHVLKPGTPGTPRNTTEHLGTLRNSPEHLGTPQNTSEHLSRLFLQEDTTNYEKWREFCASLHRYYGRHVYGETLNPMQALLGPLRSQIPSEYVEKPCATSPSQAKKGTHDTGYSEAVTHPSTNPALPGLTLVILMMGLQRGGSRCPNFKISRGSKPPDTLASECFHVHFYPISLS